MAILLILNNKIEEEWLDLLQTNERIDVNDPYIISNFTRDIEIDPAIIIERLRADENDIYYVSKENLSKVNPIHLYRYGITRVEYPTEKELMELKERVFVDLDKE